MPGLVRGNENRRISYRDGRFELNGEAYFLIGAEYQYYREPRENWQDKLRLIRAAGANTVTFYVPWRHHLVEEPPQRFDFYGTTEAKRDLVGFIRLVAEAGLLAVLKPGPFVHSELNIGGLPDSASPSFNPDVAPSLDHRGEAVIWEYDGSKLPAPFAEPFLTRTREWLQAVGAVVRPEAYPGGPVIAIQLNDETLYCTSNSPPWTLGYEESSLAAYANATGRLLEKPPRDAPLETTKKAVTERLREWSDYQWWLRRESYRRYREFLGVDLPHLSNHAGITPPIEENVPREGGRAAKLVAEVGESTLLTQRYPDWWFQMNRLEADRSVYEYGFISWLGVVAYNIADPSTIRTDLPVAPNLVFDRYVNSVARGRGVNLEENWGFAKLYHPYSASPFVPFFQTLLSIAAGGTGYTVFCAVQHADWDDRLDRMTKLQHPTFPSDAPIRSDGATTPMYETMELLNRWFHTEGKSLLKARRWEDLRFAVHSSYAAIMSWNGQENADGAIPYGGTELEQLSIYAQESGYVPTIVGLEGASSVSGEYPEVPVVALLGRRISTPAARLLWNHLESGGTLLYGGHLPHESWEGRPLPPPPQSNSLFQIPNSIVSHPESFPGFLKKHGISHRLPSRPGVRFFLYEHMEDQFIFFFKHTSEVVEEGFVIDGTEIAFCGPGRCCGVAALAAGAVRSVLFKGVNEVEDSLAAVRILSPRGEETEIRGDELRSY